MSGEILFRRATFGGFNREDVMQYISELSIENGEKEKIERELTKTKDELLSVKDSVGSKDDAINQLKTELETIKTELEAKKTKLAALESEIEVKNNRLMSMQLELEAMRTAAEEKKAEEKKAEEKKAEEQKAEEIKKEEPKAEPVDERKEESSLSAERLMQESMAYAERYIQSAGLVANNIKRDTLNRLIVAGNQLNQMRDTASQLAESSEKFTLYLEKLSNDVSEASKGFEQNGISVAAAPVSSPVQAEESAGPIEE